MAYETGGANDPINLLEKLAVFAAANGWTVESGSAGHAGSVPRQYLDEIIPNEWIVGGSTVDAPGPINNGANGNFDTGVGLAISRDGRFYILFADDGSGSTTDPAPFIGACYITTGAYNPVKHPELDTFYCNSLTDDGLGLISWTNNIPGPYQAYHFFSGEDYLHVVLEVTPGSYRHFGVGVLDSAGALTSGQYAYGLRWRFGDSGRTNNVDESYHTIPFDCGGNQATAYNSAQGAGTIIRADSDALSPRHIIMMDSTIETSGNGWGGFRNGSPNGNGPLFGPLRASPSTLTGRAVLFPCLMFAHRPSGYLSALGSPKDVRWTRIDNLAPGDLFTIGPDSWRVFPIIRKNGPSGQENSENFALAYRVVP